MAASPECDGSPSPLATSLGENQCLCQPYNDEEIVHDYIRKEIIEFDWASKQHTLVKDRETLAQLFQAEGDPASEALDTTIEDSLVRTLVASRLDGLVQEVSARACAAAGTLDREPLALEDGTLREQPVWGLDAYTRFNIRLALEDDPGFGLVLSLLEQRQNPRGACRSSSKGLVVLAFEPEPDRSGDLALAVGQVVEVLGRGPAQDRWRVRTEAGAEGLAPPHCIDTKESPAVTLFVEHVLLPAINRLPAERAFSMQDAVRAILADVEDPAKLAGYRTVARIGATALLARLTKLGHRVREEFRVHPKGTGVVVTAAQGLSSEVLVSEYIGELYPPYRWLERQDAVAAAQRHFGMPPALPDFYNILLERPSTDAQGYGIW